MIVRSKIERELLAEGLITESNLQAAYELQEKQGGKLGDLLIGLGFLTETQFQQFLASRFGLIFYTLKDLLVLKISPRDLQKLRPEDSEELLLLPIRHDKKKALHLITLAPPSKQVRLDLMEKTGSKSLQFGLSTRDSLKRAIRYHYGKQTWRESSQTLEAVGHSVKNASQNFLALQKERLCQHCGFPYEPKDKFCFDCKKPLRISSDPLVMRSIGQNWRLTERLGEGGMGLVYKAKHKEKPIEAAVKLLRTNFQVDEEAQQRFYREAQILRRLHHKNIIRIYEFVFDESLGLYLIMEFLEGSTLEEFFESYEERNERIELSVFENIISQVCDAMSYAHEQNVIHRDLKPENIYLVGAPQKLDGVKILDFGIARVQEKKMSKLTQSGATLGTPQYISPEQALAGDLDQRSDIYSLSVLIFETLTGRPLFEAESPYQYLMRHVCSVPPRLTKTAPDKNYPIELENLLLEGLEKKKEDRPANMEIFKKRFQDAVLPKKVLQEREQTTKEREKIAGFYQVRPSGTKPIVKPKSRSEESIETIAQRRRMSGSIQRPTRIPIEATAERRRVRRREQGRGARSLRGDFLKKEKRKDRFKYIFLFVLLLSLSGGGYWFYESYVRIETTQQEKKQAMKHWKQLRKVYFPLSTKTWKRLFEKKEKKGGKRRRRRKR